VGVTILEFSGLCDVRNSIGKRTVLRPQYEAERCPRLHQGKEERDKKHRGEF
jgi:hypothetical protein